MEAAVQALHWLVIGGMTIAGIHMRDRRDSLTQIPEYQR